MKLFELFRRKGPIALCAGSISCLAFGGTTSSGSCERRTLICSSKRTNDNVKDVVVIGAGVVGLAVAREFAIRDMSVLVLEKDEHIVSGASSGNSGIGCTGYDAPPDSLERKLLRRSIVSTLTCIVHLAFRMTISGNAAPLLLPGIPRN